MAHRTTSRHNNKHQSKTITITCTDAAGAAADPTALTAMVRSPSGVVTTYTYNTSGVWTKPGTGSFTLRFTPNAASVVPWEVRLHSVMADGAEAVAIAEVFVDTDDTFVGTLTIGANLVSGTSVHAPAVTI